MNQSLRFANHRLTDLEIEQHLRPSIQAVDLQNCTSLSDLTLQKLALKARLKSLRWISNPNTTPSGHLFLASHAKLESLNISGCEQFTDEACRKHLQSPTLQSLDVSFCTNLTDQAFTNITAPLAFLNIQGCSLLTDQTIEKLKALKTLKHLCLAFNEKITKTAIATLKALPLRTLKIYPLDL